MSIITKPQTEGAKVLVLDIETAPMFGSFWGLWKQNINLKQLYRDWYILCLSYKWLGEDKVTNHAIVDFNLYETEPENDAILMGFVAELLDMADVVITHNGDKFDIKRMNTRLVKHGLLPPSPFKSIDTLKVAKAHFGFTSNKLDYIAQFLNVGKKLEHEGYELWDKCLKGDVEAWKRMKAYNDVDVEILEEVYYKLRPWIRNHPNLGLYNDEIEPSCPACTSKRLVKRGVRTTNVNIFQRYQCADCGKYCQSPKALTTKEDRQNTMRNC